MHVFSQWDEMEIFVNSLPKDTQAFCLLYKEEGWQWVQEVVCKPKDGGEWMCLSIHRPNHASFGRNT